MGAPDLDRIRHVYAALDAGDAGDAGPLSDVMAPDIEWREPLGAPGVAGVFRGQATVHVWRMRDGRAVERSCHTDTALLQAARHSR